MVGDIDCGGVILRQIRHLVFAVALAALPAAAMADSSSPVGQPPLPDVHAQNPWFRYLLPNLPAAGYMVLQNTGSGTAILTGASSPDCGSLMLHQSQEESGISSMKMVSDITVPAHDSVAFAAGGYHLMCMGPKLKVGQRMPFALHFKDGSVLLLIAPVYGATSAPPGA
jgi:periplasmic copper chaperone A